MTPPSVETWLESFSQRARSCAFSFSSCSIRDSSNTRRSSSKTARSSSRRSRSTRRPMSTPATTLVEPENAVSAMSASINQRPVLLCSLLGAHPRSGTGDAVPSEDTHEVMVFCVTLAISATVAVEYARRRPSSGSSTMNSRTEDIGSNITQSNENEPISTTTNRSDSFETPERTRSEDPRRIRDGIARDELHGRSSTGAPRMRLIL